MSIKGCPQPSHGLTGLERNQKDAVNGYYYGFNRVDHHDHQCRS